MGPDQGPAFGWDPDLFVRYPHVMVTDCPLCGKPIVIHVASGDWACSDRKCVLAQSDTGGYSFALLQQPIRRLPGKRGGP